MREIVRVRTNTKIEQRMEQNNHKMTESNEKHTNHSEHTKCSDDSSCEQRQSRHKQIRALWLRMINVFRARPNPATLQIMGQGLIQNAKSNRSIQKVRVGLPYHR